MDIFILYIVTGAFTGLLSGLLGVGGGIVVVPALAFIFLNREIVPADFVMHMAIGTSLAIMVLTTYASVRAYQRFGWVLWSLYQKMALGIIIGSICGVILADFLDSELLFIIFGVFLIFVALMMFFLYEPHPHASLPKPALLTMASTGIGALASLLGVGGGVLTTPFLTRCNIAMRNATAMSAVCGFTVALIGSATNIITGWNATNLPALSTGYIFWPAVFFVAFVSVLTVPLGAKLAYHLPVKLLKRTFACFLLITGVRMLLG